MDTTDYLVLGAIAVAFIACLWALYKAAGAQSGPDAVHGLCRCAQCGAVRWWATFPCPGCEEAPTRAPGIPQAALDRTEHP
jgi:hypothetical protein